MGKNPKHTYDKKEKKKWGISHVIHVESKSSPSSIFLIIFYILFFLL